MPNRVRRTDLNRFYEEVGLRYPEEEVVYRDLRGILRKRFVWSQMRDVRGSLLDLGCNAGVYMRHFQGRLAVGVDLSRSVLHRARQRCLEQPSPTRFLFIQGDVQNLSFLHRIQFDFILCSEVLEHLFSPRKVFLGMAPLLKPGGRVLVTTPNYQRNRPTWVPLGEMRFSVSGDEYYHTAYRPEELSALAHQTGFQVLEAGTIEWEIRYASRIPAVLFVTLRFVNRCLFRSEKLERLNQRLFERLTFMCYRIGIRTGLQDVVKRYISEGIRSYALLTRGVED